MLRKCLCTSFPATSCIFSLVFFGCRWLSRSRVFFTCSVNFEKRAESMASVFTAVDHPRSSPLSGDGSWVRFVCSILLSVSRGVCWCVFLCSSSLCVSDMSRSVGASPGWLVLCDGEGPGILRAPFLPWPRGGVKACVCTGLFSFFFFLHVFLVFASQLATKLAAWLVKEY